MQIRTELIMSISTLVAVVAACSVSLPQKTYSVTCDQKRTNPAYEESAGHLTREQLFGAALRAVEDHPNEPELVADVEMETVN